MQPLRLPPDWGAATDLGYYLAVLGQRDQQEVNCVDPAADDVDAVGEGHIIGLDDGDHQRHQQLPQCQDHQSVQGLRLLAVGCKHCIITTQGVANDSLLVMELL